MVAESYKLGEFFQRLAPARAIARLAFRARTCVTGNFDRLLYWYHVTSVVLYMWSHSCILACIVALWHSHWRRCGGVPESLWCHSVVTLESHWSRSGFILLRGGLLTRGRRLALRRYRSGQAWHSGAAVLVHGVVVQVVVARCVRACVAGKHDCGGGERARCVIGAPVVEKFHESLMCMEVPVENVVCSKVRVESSGRSFSLL